MYIDYICDIMKSYAKKYNIDEKETYHLFSKKEVFEYVDDNEWVGLDKDILLDKIYEFINER